MFLLCTFVHVSQHHSIVGTNQWRLLQLDHRQHPEVGASKGSGIPYLLCKVHAGCMVCSAAYECSMLHMLFCHMNASHGGLPFAMARVYCLGFGPLPQEAPIMSAERLGTVLCFMSR